MTRQVSLIFFAAKILRLPNLAPHKQTLSFSKRTNEQSKKPTMPLDEKIEKKIQLLQEKYEAMGQNMESYLDGLLHADFLKYWDYIRLETLLSLQQPLTQFHDENIFIIYLQITELYFKLILQAVQVVADDETADVELMIRQLSRINRYFANLVKSFDIMVDGMDQNEFLQFRMSLLPASGFQSAQYRMIEIVGTDLQNLVHYTKRDQIDTNTKIADLYPILYWKSGATELATGKKTLTLKQFEKQYSKRLIRLAVNFKEKIILKCYKRLNATDQKNPDLIQAMKDFDIHANVLWPLSHYRSAVRHLERKPDVVAATGGTNWQKYLPPMSQRVVFFPEIWSTEELENWGKKVKFE